MALAEMCVTGPVRVGCRVTVPLCTREDFTLFGETSGRFVVALAAHRAAEFTAFLEGRGVAARRLGKTEGERLRINGTIDLSVEDLHRGWSHALDGIL